MVRLGGVLVVVTSALLFATGCPAERKKRYGDPCYDHYECEEGLFCEVEDSAPYDTRCLPESPSGGAGGGPPRSSAVGGSSGAGGHGGADAGGRDAGTGSSDLVVDAGEADAATPDGG